MSAQPLSQLIAPDWADALAPVADRIAAIACVAGRNGLTFWNQAGSSCNG